MSRPILPDPMLDYLPQYRVVRCVVCQYAVPPSAIPRHMKDLHHIYRGKRRSLLEYAATLDLADPDDLVLPEPQDPPIPSIPVEDGVACNREDCKYLSVTRKRMKRHWATTHEEMGLEGTHWRAVKLQTFFRGNNMRYFIVTPRQQDYHGPAPTKTSGTLVRQRSLSTSPQTLSRDPLSMSPCVYGLRTRDLELFHHYTLSTSVGLVHRGEEPSVWRTSVPQLTQEFPFVMHTLLSIAALHLGFLQPAYRHHCIATAASYQNIALRGFRSSIIKVDTSNCFATFAFCRMMIVYSLACAQAVENETYDPDDIQEHDRTVDVTPEWLKLQLGGMQLLRPYAQTIFAGSSNPFKPTMHLFVTTPLDFSIGSDDAQLASLMPMFSSADTAERAVDEICTFALTELRRAFALPYARPTVIKYRDAVGFWPIRQSPAFWTLIKEDNPKALIVLAFFCVLLKRSEDFWYLQGQGMRLLSDIRPRLGWEWEHWIEWPMRELGVGSKLGSTRHM